MAQAKHKRKFFDVDMPIINKQTQLLGYSTEDLNKRLIRYDLTRILRGKSVLLTLKVIADKESAKALPTKIQLLPYFLRRMVRKGTNYIEDSFLASCKDAKIEIKPFLITRRKVSRQIRNALRVKTKQELIDYLKEKKVSDVFDDILKNQLQKSLSIKLKKIYPLSLCEIRIFQLK